MKLKLLSQSGIFVLVILLFSACSKSGSNPTPQNNTPSIVSLSTNTGPYNTSVTITGTGFSSTAANDKVFFNGKAATVTAASAIQITAIVPIGAGTGNVTISINGGTPLSGPVFTYQLSAVVTTLAGNDKLEYIDGKGANASFMRIWGLAIDPTGNIYVSDNYNYIRKVTPDGTVSTVAGNSNGNAIGWDKDGKGSAATFLYAASLTTDNSGNVYIADGSRIRKMAPDGTVSTLQVNYNLYSGFPDFTGIVLDASGNIYASDAENNLILKLTPGGTSSIFAGSGTESSVDGQGNGASFDDPIDLGIDASGNIFVTDYVSNKIRKLTPGGLVITVAGNGSEGASNGPAMQASFSGPDGVAADKFGNLYISDDKNEVIRKIASDGTVSTVAGTGQIEYPQVDGVGTAASFASVEELKVDAAGNIYIADYNKIRKITFQ